MAPIFQKISGQGAGARAGISSLVRATPSGAESLGRGAEFRSIKLFSRAWSSGQQFDEQIVAPGRLCSLMIVPTLNVTPTGAGITAKNIRGAVLSASVVRDGEDIRVYMDGQDIFDQFTVLESIAPTTDTIPSVNTAAADYSCKLTIPLELPGFGYYLKSGLACTSRDVRLRWTAPAAAIAANCTVNSGTYDVYAEYEVPNRGQSLSFIEVGCRYIQQEYSGAVSEDRRYDIRMTGGLVALIEVIDQNEAAVELDDLGQIGFDLNMSPVRRLSAAVQQEIMRSMFNVAQPAGFYLIDVDKRLLGNTYPVQAGANLQGYVEHRASAAQKTRLYYFVALGGPDGIPYVATVRG